MTRDLRFALRMILSHRWFSAAVVVTLALGIGLNTMVFTLVNAVLFKPVPVSGGERLVAISNRNVSQGRRGGLGVSYPDFREYRARASSLESLVATSEEAAILSERGNPPDHYSMYRVSSGLFDMLHVRAVFGRGFLPGDDKPGAEPVVVLGYGVWKDRYGLSASVLNRVVRVNGKPATIAGVMPQGFKFPQNQDLWMPLVPTPEMESRTQRPLELFGMLKPGAGITQAGAELEGIARSLAAQYPVADKGRGVLVETFQQKYNGDNIRLIFLLMLGAVGFVLMIACASVANMMLSRALARGREISIRAAMGAWRWQLIRQLLIESLLLSALGGVLGLGLTALGVHAFDLATQDVGKPYWIQFTMDYRVFAYFAAICVFSGLLFGLAPALRSSRVDLNAALKDGARTLGTRRGGRLAGALVVFQFALTVVLLTGAGVFVRNLIEKESINRWVPADQLLTAGISLPRERYADRAARLRFFDQLLPRLSVLPGVTHVALLSSLPGMGAGTRRIEIEDAPLKDPSHGPSATVLVQSPGYFAAIDLPILRGRDFSDTDGDTGRQSAIVTRQFAARYWPHQPAVGKRFRFYDNAKPGEWIAVVGVSADIAQSPLSSAPDPLLFVPYRQDGGDTMSLVVRSAGSPASGVRAAVQGIDQDLALFDVRTLAASLDRQNWFLKVFGTIFLVFALTALVIASVGIYAVMAQAASARTREIGVRMALGATSRSILGLVLTRGLVQLTAGLVLGLAAAFPATSLMASMPGLSSTSDPLVFLAASAALTAVGLFACWLPARRAAALHPVNAIRYE